MLLFIPFVLIILYGLFETLRERSEGERVAELVARNYGYPKEEIILLAQVYDLSPDEIDDFGPGPFPLNYFDYHINLFEQEYRSLPPKSVVEGFVKGYKLKCSSGSRYLRYYIFYSENVVNRPFNPGLALVIRVSYEGPEPNQPEIDDPLLLDIFRYDARDSSAFPLSPEAIEQCKITGVI